MTDYKKGSLVCYKSKPALVEAVSDKIDILFFKQNKRVRDKDITFIHAGPISDVSDLDVSVPESLDTLEETIELLDGEELPLAELAELLFGDNTPQAAWTTWAMLKDDLYFEGEPDAINARPLEVVKEEKAKRDAKRQQQEHWDSLISRIKKGQIEEADYKDLTEVEQVACGERENSRILKTVGVPEAPDAAHALLVKLGYWPEAYNPWPRRHGVTMTNPELPMPEAVATERRDLQHLQAWAIDDVGNQDPDDAISYDGERLWVHIADASSLVTPDSELDIEARSRGTNIYLPDQVVHMLPAAATPILGLGLQEQSHALSISFRVTDNGVLEDIEVCFSTLKVTRTTYDEADQQLDSTFADLKAVTDRYQQRRLDNNAAMLDFPEVNIKVDEEGKVSIHPYSKGGSRQLVAESMLAAGEAIAQFALDNNIPIPFAFQPEPEEIQHPEKLSEHYAYRRCFKASRHATEPDSHFGLGLPHYTRVTSPMRRYLDLIVHQQLRAFLTEQSMLDHEALVERIGLADEGSFAARKAERASTLHWTLVYLQQNAGWKGEAIVVNQDERKTYAILPDLAMEPRLRKEKIYELDTSLTVEVKSVNIPNQNANFKIVNG